jgi:hypothetical protein
MGYGLGKRSPVILSQSRDNFEALIDRHGQWCRWRVAKKCTCVTGRNQPDIHCEKCGGSGDIYDYQKDYTEAFQLTVRNNILELPAENVNCEVLKIADSLGNEYQFAKSGQYLEITCGPRHLNQNEIVNAVIRDTVVKHLDSVVLECIGNGYYRVPGIETPPSRIAGVYYKSPGDVIKAEKVEDNEGEEVEVTGYRQNMIQVNSEAETLTAYGVDFILPSKFVVLSQNLNKADLQIVNTYNGDAVCTFPYNMNVSENDILTVLSGTMTNKIVIARDEEEGDDLIPEFFVATVNSLETQEGEYREGQDFILVGTNRIHWIGDRKPETGAAMSLIFEYYPTYRVAKNIPQLRTSENQRIPKKVVLKLYSAFGEAKGVNRNA